eukprot:3936452-Rhodomonas_salina.1
MLLLQVLGQGTRCTQFLGDPRVSGTGPGEFQINSTVVKICRDTPDSSSTMSRGRNSYNYFNAYPQCPCLFTMSPVATLGQELLAPSLEIQEEFLCMEFPPGYPGSWTVTVTRS